MKKKFYKSEKYVLVLIFVRTHVSIINRKHSKKWRQRRKNSKIGNTEQWRTQAEEPFKTRTDKVLNFELEKSKTNLKSADFVDSEEDSLP